MKHICLICFAVILTLSVQTVKGQTQDTTTRQTTVVSDRINESTDRERGASLEKVEERAEESFEKHDFYAAMKYFGFVLHAEPLRVKALKGYGESALLIANLDSAQMAFQRLVDHGLSPSPDYFPKMRLAEVKFRRGDYDGAIVLYYDIINIAQTPPVPAAVIAEARNRKGFCEWALQVSNNPDVIKETYHMLDTGAVNSPYSEYMAYPDAPNNQIYFSAYRFEFEKDRVYPKRNLIKLLTATEKDGKMYVSEVKELNDLVHQHTAHLTFSESGNTVYYALGDYLGKSAEIHFDLYRRKKQQDGLWGQAEKLNLVNAEGFTSTEPSVGTLPGEKYETLFFVSDRPGGKGGRDIWFSHIIGDSLTAPAPLHNLNTKGDEVTPFYHAASNTLYFSTDGGVLETGDTLKTIGGFDIYKSKCTVGSKWGKPKHMGMPVNSPANDVFFSVDSDNNRAYMSNNQRGNANNSEEGCCYDIYAVDLYHPRVKAIGLQKLTKQTLPFTRITLYEVNKDKQFIPVANPQPDTTSAYTFEVKTDKQYVLVAEKAGYSSDTLYFHTPEEVWHDVEVKKLYLKPPVKMIVTVYDSDTNEPLPGVTTTFFDLGFKNEAGNFLTGKGEGKVDVLPPTSNRNEYKLDYEHKYRVLAAKEGYVSDISKADSSEVISTLGRVTGGTIEVKLYLHQPSALEVYLPITLYFDNDYPKKDYKDQDTILLDYQKTFVNYIRKKDEYKEGFSKGLTGAEKQAAMDTIENFFENEVRMNWDSFFSLSDKIDLMLQRGDTIILTLKGYASPLSNPDYNFHLTNRRIASVYNHFMIFDLGIFPKYREVGGNGQLRFKREANGDSTAPKGLNKDPKNRRLSVYDTLASRERRVQIIGARVTKGSKDKRKL